MQTRHQPARLIGLFMLVLFALAACNNATADPLEGLGLVTAVNDSTIRGLAQVDKVDLLLMESFPIQVNAIVRGSLPDSCTKLAETSSQWEGSNLNITLQTTRPADAICTQTKQPFEETLALAVEGLAAGVYTVSANGVSTRFELSVDNRIEGVETTASPTAAPDENATPAIASAEVGENQTPEPSPEAARRNCKDELAFVKDVTVKDDTRMEPAQEFVKTWRLRNVGTCTWTPAYALAFFGGEQMSGPDIVPLAKEVLPGNTIDVSATLVAPIARGNYQGDWKLRSSDGKLFGVGSNRNRPFWVRIRVNDSATPTPDTSGSNISGRVWHDLCAQSPTSASTPPGCVAGSDGKFLGNGIYEENEPRIAGYEVNLGAGACPSTGLAVAIADANGEYAFANLDAGTYCISIDPLSDFNLPIFIPGEWTFPADRNGTRTIQLDGIADINDIDFGWDYQFAP